MISGGQWAQKGLGDALIALSQSMLGEVSKRDEEKRAFGQKKKLFEMELESKKGVMDPWTLFGLVQMAKEDPAMAQFVNQYLSGKAGTIFSNQPATPKQFTLEEQSALDWARKNPKNPKADRIFKTLGVEK